MERTESTYSHYTQHDEGNELKEYPGLVVLDVE